VAAVALAAFFAAGISPFATATVAHADVEDSLGDLLLDNLSAALTPVDLGGAGASAFTTSLNAIIEQLSGSLHDQIEAAVTDPVNAQLLDAINFPSVALFGRDVIGNGIEVGDPIPALGFLDQSSGPLADTFTGTNEGLLTPELAALHIDVGNLHDGGFLLGDNASVASSASTPADTLPPITCVGAQTLPDVSGGLISSVATITCDGPANTILYSDLYYDYDGLRIPIGIPGFNIGESEPVTYTTSTSLFCTDGTYEAGLFGVVTFPPPYEELTPIYQSAFTTPIAITCV
jgi:hypothetical protein